MEGGGFWASAYSTTWFEFVHLGFLIVLFVKSFCNFFYCY